MTLKTCKKCGIEKDTNEFGNDKNRPDGKHPWCKQCRREDKQKNKEHIKEYNKQYKESHKEEVSQSRKEYYQNHQEKARSDRKKYYWEHRDKELKTMEAYRRANGMKPASENPDCSLYLGTHITENAVKPVLPKAQHMPHGHPKYDYLCSQGYKIDVKSASTSVHKVKNTVQWKFKIDKNKVADYFLCVAYDNRENLNIIKMWMIPGIAINHLGQLSISPGSFDKWKQYELDPNESNQCVEEITAP